MPLYKIEDNQIKTIERTSFAEQNLKERTHLQHMIKNQIDVISPNTLIVAEEFGDWEESRRRIDLLGIDKNANLIVIELKRTEDGGHMELQSIRYAAMISTLTFEKLVPIYQRYLEQNNIDGDATAKLLEFLDWSEPNDDDFAQEIKIILASADFSPELTTSVMWLNDFGIDIQCIRMHPYNDNGETYIDIQTVIPIPEAQDYQIKIREKKQKERTARKTTRDTSLINIYYDGELKFEAVRKADIALCVVKALQDGGELDRETFDLLKNDRGGGFNLIKHLDEVTENEEKYSRYRVNHEPEIIFENTPYYVLRNWGRANSEKFKIFIEDKFPKIRITFVD